MSPPSPAPQPDAVKAALESLPVAEPQQPFWVNLEHSLEEAIPLHLAPRPAMRPITAPPPQDGVSTQRDVFDEGGQRQRSLSRQLRNRFGGPGGLARGGSKHGGRMPLLVVLVVLAVMALLVVGVLANRDAEEPTEETSASAEEPSAEETTTTTTTVRERTTTTAPPGPRGLGDDVVLKHLTVGSLQVGSMVLGDVKEVTGVEPVINQRTFDRSGGTCFESTLPGADDLTLWVRSDPETAPTGVTNPMDGVLVAVSVTSDTGSTRATTRGVTLDHTTQQLLDWYDALGVYLQPYSYAFHPEGQIYVDQEYDEVGNPYSLAYVTIGDEIVEIRSGPTWVVRNSHLCD